MIMFPFNKTVVTSKRKSESDEHYSVKGDKHKTS